MKPKDFIGKKATYDKELQMVWANKKDGGMQMLLELRGWGAIQQLFNQQHKAEQYQDDLGAWIVEAINEKLKRESK